jgi:hypothetical protein
VVAVVHDGVDWRWGSGGYVADPARYAALCRPWAGAVDAIVGTHTLGRWFGSIEGTPVVQPWPFGAELAVVEPSRDEEPKTFAIAPEAGGRWTGAGREILEKAEASVLGDLAEPLHARSGGPSPLANFFARVVSGVRDRKASRRHRPVFREFKRHNRSSRLLHLSCEH